jgi:hypothetical protein
MDLNSIKQLQKLTTPRLLALRDSLLTVPERGDWDNLCYSPGGGKESPEWQEYYAQVKHVLSGREHVPRKQKRSRARRGRKGRQTQTA